MSLANQVAQIEEENRRMKRAAGGNIVLRRRDGFERTMTFHCCPHPYGPGYQWPLEIRQASAPRFEDTLRSCGSSFDRVSYREERYHLTRETDAFGRQVYIEV